MLDFWISRTRAEAVGAVKCTAPDGKRSRGVYTGSTLVCTFCSSSAAPHADAQRDSPLRRRSLASARQLLPPPARRAHARSTTRGIAAKEPVTIRQRRDGPNGSGFALPTRASFGVSSFDRSCRERGTAHTGGFASVFVGPAVPMRRLWVQSSAYHATGRPCARPTGVRTASTSRHRPSATSRRASLRRRSRTHLAAPDTTRRPCACARTRRDVAKSARADLAMSTGTAAA